MAQKKMTVQTPKAIKKATIEAMEELGTYKPQYEQLIDIYAGLVHQYQKALRDFEAGGCVYEVETGAGGTQKSPIVATLENLRKDILQYSDRLGLNPKALKSVTVEQAKTSKLARVLSSLEE